MEYQTNGKIIKGVGGRYVVKLFREDSCPMPVGSIVTCRARGAFRHKKISPLVGDEVSVTVSSIKSDEGGTDEYESIIEEILPRKNALIRPPIANIDTVFVSMAAASPEPMPEVVDKLVSILEFNGIEPVIVIEKCELDRARANDLKHIYELAGYPVFVISCRLGEGIDEIRDYVNNELENKIAAFAGASGVGKSTLMNTLFPSLRLETSDVSRKTERGRNTTRHVELYPLSSAENCGYIADTPGFSMLDFERFDFFSKEELPLTMREFSEYIGYCRYTKCSHTKEEGCAILEAVRDGKIAKSRHDSFVSMYNVLKEKKDWEK